MAAASARRNSSYSLEEASVWQQRHGAGGHQYRSVAATSAAISGGDESKKKENENNQKAKAAAKSEEISVSTGGEAASASKAKSVSACDITQRKRVNVIMAAKISGGGIMAAGWQQK